MFMVRIWGRPGEIASAVVTTPHPSQNHLLAALSDTLAQRWERLLEPVDMPLGAVLYESGVALSHVYFPRHPTLLSRSLESTATR